MRETARLKAVRLLSTACVRVEQVDAGCVRARVAGDHGTYAVTHDGSRWRCDCPTRPVGRAVTG
jgi:hypothetical protein